MLGTINPCSPAFGGTDDMKASAAGRSDGGRKPVGEFKQAARRAQKKGSDALQFAYMAMILGLLPR